LNFTLAADYTPGGSRPCFMNPVSSITHARMRSRDSIACRQRLDALALVLAVDPHRVDRIERGRPAPGAR
jgi:hypothetical protein